MTSKIILAVAVLLAVVTYASWSPDVSVATTKVGTVKIRDTKLTQAIGLRTLGGFFSPLIVKNTAVPASITTVFSTASDNQPDTTLNFFVGNAQTVADNRSLGQVAISGFSPAPRGVPQIKVTVSVDESGDIQIAATEAGADLHLIWTP